MDVEPDEVVVPLAAFKASAWFFENSLDVFLGLEGEILRKTNATWKTLTGHPVEASAGQSFWNFIHPDDAEATRAVLAGLVLGERREPEFRLSTITGDWLWVRAHVVRGGGAWMLVILRDITAERRLEFDAEEARRAAGLLRSAAGVTVWRYNGDTDRYDINPDFKRTGQAPTAEAHHGGEEVRGAVHRADGPMLHMAWMRTLATGERNVMIYRERAADGGWRQVRAAWQGVRQLPSGRWEIIGIAQDVTELIDARDAALEGEKAALAAAEAKSQFLANMSHEIRTPMNGVLGILHLIKTDPPQAERRRLVEEALVSGGGLSDMLNDIIDYSDMESGRIELRPESIDPVEQLDSVAAMMKPRASAKGVVLRTTCALDIGMIDADAARLRKMCFHLIGNAVKFTHQGAIEVRMSAKGDGPSRRLRVEVQDTGVGMDMAAQVGLFELFQQGDGSSTRRFGGLGLGLAVTRRLARLMDGEMGFSSRKGEGSTFWFEIAAPAGDAAHGETEPQAAWLSGLRVLVVEDHATNRLVATQMLGILGAEVHTAEDGAQGVAAVERCDYDLIFMDIQMPVMDGVEATRRIRAMSPPKCQVPIVATTANVLPEQLAVYRQSGIDGVVAKPISPAALMAEVSRIAGGGEEEAAAVA